MRTSSSFLLGLFAVASLSLTGAGLEPEPATMKAVRIHAFGETSELKFEDASKPKAGVGEILVRVHVAGVNPVDWKVRNGSAKLLELPAILGYDISGVIEEVGEGVKELQKGDEVYAMLDLKAGGGYAQYVALPAKDAAKKPERADHKLSAATPLAALTAWQAMFDKAELKAGQTILIHGAAGGVGHFAVQFAHDKGAKVIATASADNAEFVKGLGADQVIDYKKEKFEDIVKNVDVVLDMFGADTLERSYGVLKENGYLISIVAEPDQEKLKARKARGSRMLVKPDGKQLAELAKMIDEGKVKPDIQDEFELKDVAKAHERSQSGGTGRGKIILTIPQGDSTGDKSGGGRTK